MKLQTQENYKKEEIKEETLTMFEEFVVKREMRRGKVAIFLKWEIQRLKLWAESADFYFFQRERARGPSGDGNTDRE